MCRFWGKDKLVGGKEDDGILRGGRGVKYFGQDGEEEPLRSKKDGNILSGRESKKVLGRRRRQQAPRH